MGMLFVRECENLWRSDSRNVTIKRVYYVKGLNHNLFSVGQFCDADLEVAFKKSTCFVRDLQGNDLLTGNRGSDLYTISLQETTSSTLICFMAKASPTQAWLWHRRLSHLNFDYITLLSKKDIVTGLPKLKYVKDQLCSSCEMSKAKRSSFKSKVVPSSKGRLNFRFSWTCCGTEFLKRTLHALFQGTSLLEHLNRTGIVERQNVLCVEIDADDLEEMDLKWQMAMLTMRARRFLNKTGRKINANGSKTIWFNKSKVERYNYHKKGHFARDCRALRENRNREPIRKNVIVETTETKALVAQDGLGYDWSDQAEDGPTNFTLMEYTSSGSSSSSSLVYEVSTCSKACLKYYETLKEHYDNLIKDFNKSQLNVGAYKAGLKSVEARLDVYKKNEVVFEEDIKILKLDIKLRDNALIELRKKFEKAKKERDDLKLTLENFGNSSKNLSKLLEIQVSDKFKTGVGFVSQVVDSQVFDSQENDRYKTSEGYHVIPPPYTGNFMPPKSDLVLVDEEEYIFSESITSKVKTSESKTKSDSEPLIEDCISNTENENEKNGGKPVWNNARRLNHQNSQRITHPHPKRNFIPRAVLMKYGLKTLNIARQNSSRAEVSVNTAKPINTAYLKPIVNCARPASNVFNRVYSHVRRPFNMFTSNKNSNFNEKVNTVKGNVTTVGSKAVVNDEANAVKASTYWV
ncbi:ribonuclease H-like domain-containing protein [Tanacetum coccineum]